MGGNRCASFRRSYSYFKEVQGFQLIVLYVCLPAFGNSTTPLILSTLLNPAIAPSRCEQKSLLSASVMYSSGRRSSTMRTASASILFCRAHQCSHRLAEKRFIAPSYAGYQFFLSISLRFSIFFFSRKSYTLPRCSITLLLENS